MKTTGEILRNKRKEMNISIVELAEAAGVSQTYVSYVENNKKSPSEKYLNLLSGILKLSSSDLEKIKESEQYKKLPLDVKLKLDELEQFKTKKIKVSISKKTKKLKVYGLAAAGTGVIEDGEFEEMDVVIPDSVRIKENDFGIKVRGDSMEPQFLDGDLVLVDGSLCEDWPLLNKKVVAVSINGEKFIKKVMFNNYNLEFHSLNCFYQPIIVSNSDLIKCHGVVSALLFRKL